MKMKKVLSLLLAIAMLLMLVACGGNGDATTTTTADQTVVTTVAGDDNVVVDDDDTTVATDENGDEVTTTVATDENGNEVTTTVATDEHGGTAVTTVKVEGNGKVTTVVTTAGNGATTRTRRTASQGTVNNNSGSVATMGEAIKIKEGTVPCEQGVNLAGKTFTYAYYGTSWNQKQTDRFADFEKQYNTKVDVRAMATSEYVAALASAIAGGTPYDLVFMHSFDYPSQITANTMMPLDDFISTADLWNKDSAEKGGFSKSLMQATSLDGKIYCIAGAYLNTPVTLYYNKKIFADAGYDGADDPMALYKSGKWSWEKLYEMLLDIQAPAKGLYGINSISPYYDHQFITSYGTDLAKLTSTGSIVENLDDAQLYKAFTMLQKYTHGSQRVVDPNNKFENGKEQFLNGTTASMIGNIGYYTGFTSSIDKKGHSAFGSSKAQQKANIGCVPIPTDGTDAHPIWSWLGYGISRGVDDEGIDFALAFVKHDSITNTGMTYDKEMPAELIKISRDIMDKDKLIGPLNGFETSAGSLDGVRVGISSKIAAGNNVTVTLKAYKKQVQTILKQALTWKN